MNEELKKIARVFLSLLQSRKFWTLLFGVLAAEFRLELSNETQALVYLVAGVVFAGTTAWEDASAKRSGGLLPMVEERDVVIVDQPETTTYSGVYRPR